MWLCCLMMFLIMLSIILVLCRVVIVVVWVRVFRWYGSCISCSVLMNVGLVVR